MTAGVSYPAFATDATFAMVTGSAHADYPAANLADPKEISRVFRASASGAIAFSFVLTAAQLVRFVALLNHNGVNAATYRIRLYSDAGLTTLVHDSGTLTFALDATSQFAKVTPYLLTTALSVRSGRIDLSTIGTAWQIGAVEVAGFLDLSTHDARSLGLKAQDVVIERGEGAADLTRQFSPRKVTVGMGLIDWTTAGGDFLDFQAAKGRSEPFVWVREYDDGTTWQREAVLMRNASLIAVNKGAHIYGSTALDLIEHLR